MTDRDQWRRTLRQNLNRLTRLFPQRHNAVGRSLYDAQCNRVLHSRSALAATMAEIVSIAMTDDEIWSASASIDMFAPYSETITWFRQQKRSHGHRVVCAPPVTLKVRQRLLTRMIVAQQPPDPHIFNWKGRGCARQAKQIQTALEDGGRYVVIADVRDCFPSVNFDAVYELNLLPPEVIRFASDSRHLNFVQMRSPQVPGNDDYTWCSHGFNEQAGPRGLLQGLGSSDALWVSLISDLPERLSAHGVPFIYCDNIAVVCGTQQAAAEAEESLVRYFSDHRAGPLSLTMTTHDAALGFEHTGYSFGTVADGDDVWAMISPSIANTVKVMAGLHGEVRRIKDAKAGYDDAPRIFDRKLSGFSAISEEFREELRSSFIAEIEDLRPT